MRAKPPLDTVEGLRVAMAEIEQQLGENGRLLVRYSGTESLLRIMVEGPKRTLLQQYADTLATIVKIQIGA